MNHEDQINRELKKIDKNLRKGELLFSVQVAIEDLERENWDFSADIESVENAKDVDTDTARQIIFSEWEATISVYSNGRTTLMLTSFGNNSFEEYTGDDEQTIEDLKLFAGNYLTYNLLIESEQ